jgi:hypothetical protein
MGQAVIDIAGRIFSRDWPQPVTGMTAAEDQTQPIILDLHGRSGRIFFGHFVQTRSNFRLEQLQAPSSSPGGGI